MADSRIDRLLNPCLFHLQKMELELKCPFCLKLFNNPVLLPCSHICCSSCIINHIENQILCPECKLPHLNKEFKEMQHLETMVAIFKGLNTSFVNLINPSFKEAALENKGPYLEAPVVCNSLTTAKVTSIEAPKVLDDKINTQSSNAQHVACTNGEPCSPPSFGDMKDSDNDSNDSQNVHKLQCKISCKRKIADGDVADIIQSPMEFPYVDSALHGVVNPQNSHLNVGSICFNPSKVDPQRELKRMKLEDSSHENAGANCKSIDELNNSENVAIGVPIANSGLDVNNDRSCSILPSDMLTLPCVFCHSSAELEFTGPMLHYDDSGNPLDLSQAMHPTVTHVHEKCIDWAPQVYFEGNIAKNIDSEVSRAAKIRCSKCGEKGAALGCYSKSCRKSFHVPCALEISGCRWDNDNFLMLCPTHFSNKFPCDRSKTRKKGKTVDSSTILDSSRSPKDPMHVQGDEDTWTNALDVTRGWVLCGSGLSSSENNLLAKFAKKVGASVSRDWQPNVTHVIASIDELGACSRTLKYLMAILGGKWILNIDWIKVSMNAKCHVDEENYEINHDKHGCFGGPKNGRMRIMEKEPPLFHGRSFYFSGHFELSYKGYLEDLISVAGGKILKEIDSSCCESKSVVPKSYIVYNLDPPEDCDVVDQSDAIKRRLEEADSIATLRGSQVVAHTWVLDSIAACKLQPLFC